MNNNIQIFNNAEFGNIRTIQEGDKVLFCGKDVAAALGYEKPRNAIERHCRGALKRGLIDSLGREQEAIFIPEGDLYRLICNSKLPSAEKFERWVFDEVLPTIRKHGLYATKATVEKMLNDPDTLITILQELKTTQEKCKALAAEASKNAEAAVYVKAVRATKNDILMRDMAKLLRQNGFPVGEKRLFAILREKGFLMRTKEDWNRPTQRAMELGLFKVHQTIVFNAIGRPKRTVYTTRVTPKGQQYLIRVFMEGQFAPQEGE